MEPIRQLRLIELALLIASAADIGMGQPAGSSVRKGLLSLEIATSMGWKTQDQSAVLYTSLLRWAGCTAHGNDFYLLFDDEIEVHSSVITLDFSTFEPLAYIARHAGEGRGFRGMARTLEAARPLPGSPTRSTTSPF